MRPIIGITADATTDRFQIGRAYVEMVERAGGLPIVLPCVAACVEEFIAMCDGFIFTGGDDPIMEHWGVPTHPKAKPIDPARQRFELALLEALDQIPEKPVLGICLGMQLMGLHAGGALDQHLPDHLPTADSHWNRTPHEVAGEIGCGTVMSHHRQALTDGGAMRVIGTSPDGVIEAVRLDDRPFYLGVQWHPERTADPALGIALFEQLMKCASSPCRASA